MNNTRIGTKTEKSVSNILREHGYWIYNCPKSQTGSQPFDLIAFKGGQQYLIWLIDGKHVRINEVSFRLDRIEPNQWASMRYAIEFAKLNPNTIGFVIEFERTGTFYWLSYQQALELVKSNRSSVNLAKLKHFEEVLNEHDN